MNEKILIESLYPRLAVRGADAAIAFYVEALGAELVERYAGPDGTVVHAMLRVGPVRWAVKDADSYDPAPGDPASGEAVPGTILALEVTDADAVASRLEAAGATVRFPVADQPYGERGGRLVDPFGHQWMVSQKLEDLTPEEVQARTDAMFAGGS
ncbi:MAG: VOC family protein [Pseudonocardia sp.]|nr:VOC family protein [Pseudonocardia sp.]